MTSTAAWGYAIGSVTLASVASLALPASPPQVTFTSRLEAVAVDVVATDVSDRPVQDLTAHDFKLSCDGQSREIATFEHVLIAPAPRNTQVALPPSDIASNVPLGSDARVWVFVVDDLHMLEGDIPRFKSVLGDLVASLGTDDSGAVVFVGHSDLSINVTNDHGRLFKGVEAVGGAAGFAMSADGKQTSNQEASVALDLELDAARSAATTLQHVASALAHSAFARRVIVYIGPFSHLDPSAPLFTREHSDAETLGQALRSVFKSARESDVPIYTIDPRGIPSPETSVRGWGALTQDARAAIAHGIVVQQDYLGGIAASTDGRSFVNRSDLRDAVDRIVQDNSSFYLLGFYPPNSVQDGRQHKIEVAVQRSGVSVRFRRSYTDDSPTEDVLSTGNRVVSQAMTSALGSTAVELSAFEAPVDIGGRDQRMLLVFQVTYPTGGSDWQNDELLGSVIAVDPEGKGRIVSSRTLRSPEIDYDPASRTVIVDSVFISPTNASLLRVLVGSRLLGRVGTVDLPLASVVKAHDGVSLTPLLLGVESTSRPRAAGLESLRDVVPFQPTVIRAFAGGQVLRVFATAQWRTDSRDAGLRIAIESDGRSIRETRDRIQLQADRHVAMVDSRVQLAGLARGSYVLRVEISVAGGGTVDQTIPFSIR